MKRALLSIGFLFTLCVSSVHAQLFCSIFGGVGTDDAFDVLATADSGFVVAGSTNTYGAGGKDFYVLKYTKSGSIQWSKTIGDFGNEIAYGISVATNGDYIIAGETNSLGNGGEVYVARLSASGNLLWTRSVGGAGYDYAKEIASTTDNGCAVIATTGSYGHGGDDAYILKLDSNGAVQWNIAIGDVNTDGGQGILASSDGNIVVAGRCFPAAGGAQLLVVKLDYSGTILYSNHYASHDAFDFFVASDIVESNGNYVISGYCDTIGGSNKNSFLTSITAAGVHNWTRIIGIAGNDNGYGMEKTSDGGYIISGNYYGTTAKGFVIKTDSLGIPSWYIRSTAAGNNFSYAVAQLKDGNYISAGNIDSDGSVDVFLVKYDLLGNTCCGAAVGVTNALLACNPGVYGLDSIGGAVDSGGVAGTGGTASIICNSPVGIESVSQAENVLIYPNPAKGELNISNVLEFDRVVIMNALGVKVYDEAISNKEKISIQLSTFPPGTYFVHLRSKNKQVTKKLNVE